MIRIVAPHFVAGATIKGGRIYRAAPIIKYMHGWDMTRVIKYCNKKGWKHEEV